MLKKLLILLIIVTNIHSISRADDIMEIQLEGMSVGDSLLNYFSNKEITDKINSYSNKGYIFNNKDFYSITFRNLAKFEIYEGIQIYLKDKDKNFTIQGLAGFKYYKNNINKCYSDLNSIEKQFDSMFKNSTKVGSGEKRKHIYDKSGESTTTDYYYYLNNNNYEFVSIVCTDWSKKMNMADNFQVQISSYEFGDFLFNRAYE